MDTVPLYHLNEVTFQLSPDESTHFTSSGGDYMQAPLSSADLQAQPFPCSTSMSHNPYQQQPQQQEQFTLQCQSNQSLYSIDTSPLWPSSTQQDYIATASLCQPKQPTHTPLSATSSSSIKHNYIPLAKRPSIASSTHSTLSDNEEEFTADSAGERRRERRRVQNRAAQRAFRARKEETLKESSTRLDALQAELTALQSNNATLSSTVNTLRARIAMLQQENTQLKRNSIGSIDTEWANFDLADSRHPTPVPAPLTKEVSHDSGVHDVEDTSSRP